MSRRRRTGPRPTPAELAELLRQIEAAGGIAAEDLIERFGDPEGPIFAGAMGGADRDEDDWDDDDWDDDDWDDDPDQAYGPAGPGAAADGAGRPWRAMANPARLDPAEVQRAMAGRLANLRASDLRALAAGLGWTLRGQRRDDLLGQVAGLFGDPRAWARALEQLDPADRRLLALLAWQGHVAFSHHEQTLARLAAADGRAALAAPDVRAGLRSLFESGWLLKVPSPRATTLALVPSLAQALLPVPALSPPIQPPPPAAVRSQPDPLGAFLGLLCALGAVGEARVAVDKQEELAYEDAARGGWLVRAADRRPAAAQAGGWVQVPAAGLGRPKALDRFLAPGDGAAPAAMHLACALGLGLVDLGPSGGESAFTLNQGRLASWLTLPPPQQLYHLVAAWLNLPYDLWSELARVQLAGGRFRVLRRPGDWRFPPEAFNGALLELRWAVLGWLRGLPRGGGEGPAWVAGEPTLRHLAAVIEPLLVPGDGSPWRIDDRHGQAIRPGSAAAWAEVTRPVLETLVEGPLTWLGLVASARGRKGALAFGLTALGTALVDDGAVSFGTAPAGQWQGDGQLSVPAHGAAAPLLALGLRYGQAVAFRQGRLHFAWSAENLAAAFAQGETPAGIAAALREAGAAPDAAALARLAELADRWGNVILYQDLAVMAFADAITAREAAHQAKLDQVGVCQVSDTCWLVHSGEVPALVESLRAAGHTPRLAELGAPARPAQGGARGG